MRTPGQDRREDPWVLAIAGHFLIDCIQSATADGVKYKYAHCSRYYYSGVDTVSKTIGSVIPESLFARLEDEMLRKGYISISEAVRAILREYLQPREEHTQDEPNKKLETTERLETQARA